MFQRMVNPRRVLMVLASARKALNHQDHTIFRNACPQIRQIRTLPQVLQPRSYCSAAEAEVEEAAETNQVLSILKEKGWSNETQEKLIGISDISERTVALALKSLTENPEKALSFFTWYKNHPSYKPSSSLYNVLVRMVGGKAKHMQEFWEVTEEMKGHGFLFANYTLNLVNSRLRRENRGEDMAKLFILVADSTKNRPPKPLALNCSEALQCLAGAKSPAVDLAYRVIDAFKNCDGAMDKKIYDGFHRCLTKAGRFEEAEKVMDTMNKEGFAPDNITYSQLIFGLCDADRRKDARKIIREMKGKGCDPDCRTWTILIKAHCNANKTERVLSLFLKMVESGCNADSKVIEEIVTHLCERNRVMDAFIFMCKVIDEQKVKPSSGTYVEIIKKLAQSKMLKEACEMFELMNQHGHLPCAKPIYELIAKIGSVEDALEFLSKAELSAKRCVAMFYAFCNAGRKGDAHALLLRCPPELFHSYEISRMAKGISLENTQSSPQKAQSSHQKGFQVKKKF